jgi:Fe(3+) dicitrate transport protein
MNRIALFLLLACAALPLHARGQLGVVFGKVLDEQQRPVANADIFFENTSIATSSNRHGEYRLEGLAPGQYTVVAFAFGMATQSRKLQVGTQPQRVDFLLSPLGQALEEVQVSERRVETFGIARLSAVEGMAIYEGKKSEVVVMQDLNANLATNNSRQVFSKVAGLNIWESDGAGLQLGVGGRGLSPNRMTNFNTRQNGYDISADPMGYPDAYYSPPMQALERIEVVRGAASLQYGPQFGGLVNFVLKKGPSDKRFELETANTVGSYGFVNTYNSIGGTVGKVQYYGYYQYRRGDGWRDNAGFGAHAAYGAVRYRVSERLTLSAEYTKLHYLAQQAGGLTDAEFEAAPRQSKRDRNWFLIDWNVASAAAEYAFSPRTQLQARAFGLLAGRDAVGNLDRIDRADDGAARTLLRDGYANVGAEARFIHRYAVAGKPAVFLLGARTFSGHTDRRQGLGTDGSDADFGYTGEKGNNDAQFDLRSLNFAGFAEHIFDLTDKLSITPGLRFEYIRTGADGFFREVVRDLAGNLLLENIRDASQERARTRWLAGVGLSYKPSDRLELYANLSQNYRPISFNDVAVAIPSLRVDPDLQDESGFNADAGLRGQWQGILTFDASVFLLQYRNRIGEVLASEDGTVYRYRTNISDSRNIGIETFAEADLWRWIKGAESPVKLSVFSNATLLDARYVGSQEPAYRNRRVEYVPQFIFRTGLSFERKGLKATYQYSYVSGQYSDATNAERRPEAVVGFIPAYGIMDLHLSYAWGRYKAQAGINNLADAAYFTRRATGYPGPGIIPSDGRTFYLTFSAKFGH